eukprot:CAMPEP_0204619410 /NCGR_PEP_ID=MMETSP0717-20131115/5797_1 /ASSEMBLY_ACC=CAM_ASM_000666 /TAXON_ID=230516 /ORGANISM="Chaetoceros curvisetus" /LENGTH=114 /DNA_ID=CAMNT_0051633409 /DNA_START=277 /DNA_END=621 /DNA_ORIENTATION=-
MEMQPNDYEIVSHLRRSANIESDREELEELAKRRSELKLALEHVKRGDKCTSTSSSDQDDGYFMASSYASSFFKNNAHDTEQVLENLLKEVEMEIVEICSRVQRNIDSNSNPSS